MYDVGWVIHVSPYGPSSGAQLFEAPFKSHSWKIQTQHIIRTLRCQLGNSMWGHATCMPKFLALKKNTYCDVDYNWCPSQLLLSLGLGYKQQCPLHLSQLYLTAVTYALQPLFNVALVILEVHVESSARVTSYERKPRERPPCKHRPAVPNEPVRSTCC